jgi:hypothetical protein
MRLLYWRVARANNEAADVSPCLQNTCRLSVTVAHLGLRPPRVGQDRFVPDPVVVRLQPWRPRAAGLTLKRQHAQTPEAEAVGPFGNSCPDVQAT